jgi:hypothetical protein
MAVRAGGNDCAGWRNHLAKMGEVKLRDIVNF